MSVNRVRSSTMTFNMCIIDELHWFNTSRHVHGQYCEYNPDCGICHPHYQSMPILRFEQFKTEVKAYYPPWEDKPSLIDDINDTMNRIT